MYGVWLAADLQKYFCRSARTPHTYDVRQPEQGILTGGPILPLQKPGSPVISGGPQVAQPFLIQSIGELSCNGMIWDFSDGPGDKETLGTFMKLASLIMEELNLVHFLVLFSQSDENH